MKTMKGLSVNRMIGSIKRRATSRDNASGSGDVGGSSGDAATPAGTPEATAHNSVKAFCESGGNVKGDEVLFLPPIVDAAESSPLAAAECARIIRKYMSKDYVGRPAWQYNAIMLLRILTDNPGETFTRNLDQKFVDTTKQLLKAARDHSVRQILMETLDDFENSKQHDGNLALVVSMWKKEKEKAYGTQPPRHLQHPPLPPPQQMWQQPPYNPHSQNYFARNHNNKTLPDPIELAHRLEEARTSAKLLEQVVMNTPPDEFLENELIKEFADRCQSASRSIQGYMISENPAPDNDTMESLIDTNEQLQTALNQHKRAILNARKQLGLGNRDGDSPNTLPPTNGTEPNRSSWGNFNLGGPPLPIKPPPPDNGKGKQTYTPPPGPPPGVGSSSAAALGSGPGRYPPEPSHETHGLDDPFRDPQPGPYHTQPVVAFTGDYNQHSSLPPEPFHPGFKPTESYLGRQDSAVDKLTMHGAGTKPTPTVSTTTPPPRKPQPEVSDDEDLYDASPRTPKTKEPIYRY